MINEKEIEIELKPCPFCGGEAKWYQFPSTYLMPDVFLVGCANGKCGTCPETKEYPNREDAIRAWNERV